MTDQNMNMVQRNLFLAVIALLVVAVAALGIMVYRLSSKDAPAAEEKFIYQSSMHPWIVSDKPGKCPVCGMDLDKRPLKDYLAEKALGGNDSAAVRGVSLSRTGERLTNVKTEIATSETFAPEIIANGMLTVDMRSQRHLSTPVAGKIVKQYITFEGQVVAKGQPAFEIYSPDVVTSEREYLVAFENLVQAEVTKNEFAITSAKEVLESAKQRLQNWQIAPEEIRRLERTKDVRQTVVMRAEYGGVITRKIVHEGHWAEAGEDLYDIDDYSTLWAVANVYNDQLSGIKTGMAARVMLGGAAGDAGERTVYQGKVSYIAPTLGGETRTAEVRIDVPNPKLRLRPNTFAEVQLQTGKGRAAVMVSKTAVLRTGAENFVWKKVAEGQFERTQVTLAGAQGGRYAIAEGVDEGDEVVAAAGFLLDSESELQSARAAGADRFKNSEGNDALKSDVMKSGADKSGAAKSEMRPLSAPASGGREQH